MAKQEKVQHVRVAKGKSPRQLAKKAENERRAKERLERLQAEQTANEIRKAERLAEYRAELTAQVESEQAAAQREAYQKAYVDAALTIFPFKRWLANRLPTFERAKKFFDRAEIKHPFEYKSDAPKAA